MPSLGLQSADTLVVDEYAVVGGKGRNDGRVGDEGVHVELAVCEMAIGRRPDQLTERPASSAAAGKAAAARARQATSAHTAVAAMTAAVTESG